MRTYIKLLVTLSRDDELLFMSMNIAMHLMMLDEQYRCSMLCSKSWSDVNPVCHVDWQDKTLLCQSQHYTYTSSTHNKALKMPQNVEQNKFARNCTIKCISEWIVWLGMRLWEWGKWMNDKGGRCKRKERMIQLNLMTD